MEEFESRLRDSSDASSSAFSVNDTQITSWRISERSFFKGTPPTTIRGLFTADGKILARGYNKFFSNDQHPSASWDQLASTTRAPYHAVLKTNGCLVIISALKDDVFVASKHAQGVHATQSRRWLDAALRRVRSSVQELAQHLSTHNLTALAELCDDAFEEHVLPCAPAGLHLHGLVVNTPQLLSLPPDQVDAFARKFGFHSSPRLTFNDLPSLRSFAESSSAHGTYDGKPIEGFVVRAPLSDSDDDRAVFMFKIKYDQPYLRWRSWRELSRTLLDHLAQGSDIPSTTSATLDDETRHYLDFIRMTYHRDAAFFDEWALGRGIIRTRDAYYTWANTDEGRHVREHGFIAPPSGEFTRTLLVPISVPAAGKSRLFTTLKNLYPSLITHIQNDDLATNKKSAPAEKFISAITSKLLEQNDSSLSPIVLADRNNHLLQHRQQMRDVAARVARGSQSTEHVRLVALVWDVHTLDRKRVIEICRNRILDRGQNHRTLRVTDSQFESIVPRFLAQLSPFDQNKNIDDRAFDLVINLNLDSSPQEMVKCVVNALGTDILGHLPTNDEIIAASHKSLDHHIPYVPVYAPRYYALFIPQRRFIQQLFDDIFNRDEHRDSDAAKMYASLRSKNRLCEHAHITVVHERQKEKYPELWQQAVDAADTDTQIEVTLGPRLLYDDSVLLVQASIVPNQDTMSTDKKLEFLYTATDFYHITLGTVSRSVPGINALLLLKNENGICLDIGTHTAKTVLRGMK